MSRRTHAARTASVLLAAALGSFGSLSGLAQVPEPAVPESATPVPPEAAPLEEEKLDQFADAYLVIEEIHSQAAAELEATDDPAAAETIKSKAEGQIIKAVESSGLELDEFNQIAELMAVDLAVRQRVADKVERRRRI